MNHELECYTIGKAVAKLKKEGITLPHLATKIRFYENEMVFSWARSGIAKRTLAGRRFYKKRDVEEMFFVFQMHGLITIEGFSHLIKINNALRLFLLSKAEKLRIKAIAKSLNISEEEVYDDIDNLTERIEDGEEQN